jgi:hypothetical protein
VPEAESNGNQELLEQLIPMDVQVVEKQENDEDVSEITE